MILSTKKFISALIGIEHAHVTALVAARPEDVLPKTTTLSLISGELQK